MGGIRKEVNERWFPTSNAETRKKNYRIRLRQRPTYARATDFQIELTILRRWEMLHSPECPKDLRFFADLGTFKWQHRLACILAWNREFIKNPWSDLIFEHLDLLEGEKQILNIVGAQNCLHEEEMVRMWDGSAKPIKEVQVGDKLLGDNQDMRTVVDRCGGVAPLYEITPKVGRPWRCTGNHKLVLKRTSEKKPHGRSESGIRRPRRQERFKRKLAGHVTEITVEDWLDRPDSWKARNMQFTAEERHSACYCPIDPRLYGLWLGDGGIGQPVIHCDDSEVEVLDFIHLTAQRLGKEVSRYEQNGKTCHGYRVKDYPEFIGIAKQSSSSGKKRILRWAFGMSRESRLQLLAGIVDSDGGLSNNCQFVITMTSRGLILDIQELAQGLGFRCSFKQVECVCTNAEGRPVSIGWRLAICGDIDIIPTLRKIRIRGPRENKRRKHGCTGIDVTPCGPGRFVGITVDGNHHFCLDDYTVVSNSTKSQSVAAHLVQLLIEDPEYVGCFIASPYREATTIGIWGNVKDNFRRVAPMMGWNADACIKDSTGAITVTDGDRAGWIKVVSVDKVGMLQGKKPRATHRGGLYLLIEESGAFDKNPGRAVWDVLQNLTGQPRFKGMSTCNFKSVFGLDGRLCHPLRKEYKDLDPDKDHGWDSVLNGYTMRLDGHFSPNVGKKVKPFPFIVGDSDAARLIAAGHGTRSAKYLEQIRSFPLVGASDFTVTNMTKLRAGGAFSHPEEYITHMAHHSKWAFADPGLGGDPFKVAIAEEKRVETGILMRPISMEAIEIEHDRKWSQADVSLASSINPGHGFEVGQEFTEECQGALFCAKLLRDNNIPATQFGYDGSMRASVQRAMDLFIGMDSLSMDYMGLAPDEMMPSGIGKASELYGSFITFLWFLAADMMESGFLREADAWSEAMEQMCNRQWEWAGKRKKMETKDSYKERNANESPNDADAVVGLLYLLYRRSGWFERSRPTPEGTGVLDYLLKKAQNLGVRRRSEHIAVAQVAGGSRKEHLVWRR